jgi:hypothetical protein
MRGTVAWLYPLSFSSHGEACTHLKRDAVDAGVTEMLRCFGRGERERERERETTFSVSYFGLELIWLYLCQVLPWKCQAPCVLSR